MNRKTVTIASIVAITLLLLGTSLLIIGHIYQNSDIFHGIISGLVVQVVTVAGWLIFCLYNSLNNNILSLFSGSTRLSSRITFFLKFFPPYYLLAAWLTISVFIYFSIYKIDVFLPLTLFFAFLFGLACIISYQLRHIFSTNEQFIIGGYRSMTAVSKADGIIHKVAPVLAWLKTSGSRYYYLPALSKLWNRAF
jgi:hypothetical protein